MANLDGLGSLLGFGYGLWQNDKRQKALDEAINVPGATPLDKMNAMERFDPTLPANPAWQGQKQKAYEFVQTQKAAEAKLETERAAAEHEQAVNQGFAMYSEGMPGEGGKPITAEQSRNFQGLIAMNAPAGSPTRTLGNTLLSNLSQGGIAETAAGAAADQEQARAERDNDWKVQAARQAKIDQDWLNRSAEARAAGKPPAGWEALPDGKLRPKVGTTAHTEIIDRVNSANKAANAMDDYRALLIEGNVGTLTGPEKAKADALRSQIATGVMLAAKGKSDADYQIALDRVPDLASMRTFDKNKLASLDVLRDELSGAVKENQVQFGHVVGFPERIPSGFVPRPKPKAATR